MYLCVIDNGYEESEATGNTLEAAYDAAGRNMTTAYGTGDAEFYECKQVFATSEVKFNIHGKEE